MKFHINLIILAKSPEGRKHTFYKLIRKETFKEALAEQELHLKSLKDRGYEIIQCISIGEKFDED